MVVLNNGRAWTVEEKLRVQKWDDILIEYVSVLESGKVGWAVNDECIAQILVYGFKSTGKFFAFPSFPQLRKAAKAHRDEWHKHYGWRDAQNEGYITRNIPVPPAVLRAAGVKFKEFDVRIS